MLDGNNDENKPKEIGDGKPNLDRTGPEGDSNVSSNPIYGFHRPDACEDYDFGAPLDARAVINPPTQYDSEHVLKFQFLQQLLAHLDLFLGPFDHPNTAVTRKLSFCQLILEHNINTPAKGKAWAVRS